MDFTEKMKLALQLYEHGKAVVLKGTNGQIIHGQQDLTQGDCQVVGGVDLDLWQTSNWPKLLDGARERWLKNRD